MINSTKKKKRNKRSRLGTDRKIKIREREEQREMLGDTQTKIKEKNNICNVYFCIVIQALSML